MAGFLFVMDSLESINHSFENGEYSTRISIPTKSTWGDPATSTLGDYATMRTGDNVYFFAGRKIYGIGSIVGPSDSSLAFYQSGANSILPFDSDEYGHLGMLMLDQEDNPYICPWVVKFSPDPAFFEEGIDMDDMLASSPNSFRSLRCIEGRTFIKLDDRENLAFMTLFYRRNEGNLSPVSFARQVPTVLSPVSQESIRAFVRLHRKRGTSEFQRESHLETSLLMDLATEGTPARSVFGKWDYLSHQVHASPFKPVKYMDRMDIFGYQWIQGHKPMISRYVVIELKKGKAAKNDISQLLRYVDWITEQYADGDCSLVEGYLVAHEIGKAVITNATKWPRYFTRPKGNQRKPVWENIRWNGMHLVNYSICDDGLVEYSPVAF